jgi:hypothetical protein
LDDEDRVRNVFWVDAKVRDDYQEFGDVISFDTTYITGQPVLCMIVSIMYGGMHLFNRTTKPSTNKIVLLLFNSTSIISLVLQEHHNYKLPALRQYGDNQNRKKKDP